MVTVIDILNKVTDRSLVLFDELGSGTDPIEGAALAISVLEAAKARGAITASTTHYAELKAYALNTEGGMNASCEFDVETLRPTYKLIIGTPGRSNAFLISEKLGMPREIIDRAEELIRRDDKRFEDVIEKLDRDRVRMEEERELAERLRAEYESFKAENEERLRKKIEKSEAEISKAVERARQILDSARASSEFIFKQLEDLKKQENRDLRSEMIARAREEVRERMRESERLISGIDVREVAEEDDYKLPRPIVVGDKVYLTTLGKEGVVTALKDKNGLYAVTSGILKTKVSEDKLRLMEAGVKYKRRGEDKPKVSEGKVKKTIVSTFKPEVDVRGMIGDDAWFVVDKYLDDAILAGISSVRIIHGKGTGALRAALWRYFKSDRRIAAFRHGAYGEGDAGVTVVELKK